MNYCLTMEQTRRIAVWFDADSDEEAEKKAREIYHNTFINLNHGTKTARFPMTGVGSLALLMKVFVLGTRLPMLRVRRWKNIFIVKDCLSLTAIRSAHLPA